MIDRRPLEATTEPFVFGRFRHQYHDRDSPRLVLARYESEIDRRALDSAISVPLP